MLWKLTLVLINDGLVLWLNVMFRLISAPSLLSANKGNKPNSWLTDGPISTANVGSRGDNQPSGRKRVEQPVEAWHRCQRCRMQTDRNKRGVSLIFPAALVLLNPSCCRFQDMSAFIWLMLCCLIKCFMAETIEQMNTGHEVNNGKVGTIIAFIDSDSLYDSVIVVLLLKTVHLLVLIITNGARL